MSWKDKRDLIPGGIDGLISEIAVTTEQIGLVADPTSSIHDALSGLHKKDSASTSARIPRNNSQP